MRALRNEERLHFSSPRPQRPGRNCVCSTLFVKGGDRDAQESHKFAIALAPPRMTASDRGIFEYTDVAGGFLRSNNWIQPTGSPSALAAAIQAATNSNIAFLTSGQPIVGTVTPVDALYMSVYDVLQVTMQTAAGNNVQIPIPAPLGTMFQSGGIVIDPTNATWLALLAQIVANVTDVAGNAALSLVSAVKTSRRSDQVNG